MKQTKKILCMVTVLVLSLLLAVPALAAEAPVSVTLRIEGAEKTLFYDTVEVPYQADMTAWDVIAYADQQDETLTVIADPTGYIIGINNENASQFGWDGWMYRVNGKEISEGASACKVQAGDNIVLYYSDTYGAGFQFTQMDSSKISDGILKFTSTAFDWNTMQDVTSPIAEGATVTWGYGEDQTAIYTTDANGEIKIDAAQLTSGKHAVQIEKYSDIVTAGGKLPLVLRLPSDTVVEIKAPVVESSSVSSTPSVESTASVTSVSSEPTKESGDLESPKTGDTAALSVAVLVGLAAVCALVIGKKQTAC